jgi:hypothetical protein
MKKFLIAAPVIIFLLFGGYAIAWHAWARGVQTSINNFRADMAAQGTVIDGTFTAPAGFPGPIIVSFAGTMASDGRAVTIPMLTVAGFFLPGTSLRVELPQGIKIHLPDRDDFSSSLDAALLDVTVPRPLPAAFRAPALNTWREKGGIIPINHVEIRKSSLNLAGKGTLALDERLQPVLQMPANMTGHTDFLLELQQRNLVKMQQAMIAGAALTALSKPGENDIPTVTANLSIQNSTLYVGPIRVIDVPPVFWPE